jgi:GcrA cell cycle regulator
MGANDRDWDQEEETTLSREWDEGLSTAEIGRRHKRSKNSIVGKAHRFGLPGRPSPIVRGDDPAKRPKPRAPKVTLPPLLSDAVPLIALKAEAQSQSQSVAAGQPIPGARDGASRDAKAATRKRVGPGNPPKPKAPPPPAPPAPIPTRYRGTCQWPIGEPGTPSFRFCDAPALAGMPYCEKCAEKAYPLFRERRRSQSATA